MASGLKPACIIPCGMTAVRGESAEEACEDVVACPAAAYGSNRSVPKQWGRWKLSASTGDHEAQWGCDVPSPHL